MIANPYYFWPHHGDEAYELEVGEPIGGADDAVPIESLPSETARAIDEALEAYESDAEPPVYESRADVPTDGIPSESGRPAVRADGTDYVLMISEVDRSPPLLPESPLVRAVMGSVGAVAITLGAVTAVTGSSRLTTRRAWAIVTALGVVLGATIAYDGGVHGVAITGPGTGPLDAIVGTQGRTALGVLAWFLPAIGLVIGVAFRRRRWRDGSRHVGEPLCVLAFVVVTWLFTVPGILLGILIGEEAQ
ncbi:hypothetical protein [Natrinema longum]|nr:hypothetical protein [Natrinema longum]